MGFKDIIFDQKNKLSLRLYKPKSTNQDSNLHVVFYFHDGGFCLGSHEWPNCHNCYILLLSYNLTGLIDGSSSAPPQFLTDSSSIRRLQALVVSPDYRLAPEHKLLAAIDDAMSAVEWLLREALGESTNNCDAWMAG
ncbi:unnamed protein product [Malus baccata var. baccata]